MKLTDYLTDLRDLLQEPDPTGRYSDEELTRYINAGRRQVATDLRLLLASAEIVAEAGATQVALPADYVAFFEWLDEPPDRTEIIGGQVVFPSALAEDTTLRFRYFRLPVDLVGADEEAEIPLRHREGVIYAAHWKALESENDPMLAGAVQRAEARYLRWLQQARGVEGGATYRWPVRVRRARW